MNDYIFKIIYLKLWITIEPKSKSILDMRISLERSNTCCWTVSRKEHTIKVKIHDNRASEIRIGLNWPTFDSDKKYYSILKEESANVDSSIKEKYDNTFRFYDNTVYWSKGLLGTAIVKSTQQSLATMKHMKNQFDMWSYGAV